MGLQLFECALKESYLYIVSFCGFLDLETLISVSLNKLEVFPCNVIVVLFHLTECSLVVLHQLVDVLVFTLLDLVDLNLLA